MLLCPRVLHVLLQCLADANLGDQKYWIKYLLLNLGSVRCYRCLLSHLVDLDPASDPTLTLCS